MKKPKITVNTMVTDSPMRKARMVSNVCNILFVSYPIIAKLSLIGSDLANTNIPLIILSTGTMLNRVICEISLKVKMALSGKPMLKRVTNTINCRVLIVPQSIWMDEDLKIVLLNDN
jgi:hypothetical protein